MSNTVILSDAVLAAFEAAAEREYEGVTASARKGGRNPKWPFVPVILYPSQRYGTSQSQIKGVAYATREEAVEVAAKSIAANKAKWAADLAKPAYRAHREYCGFAAELKDVVA